MLSYAPPKSIAVEYPAPDAPGSTHHVIMHTALFREDCNSPEVLDIATQLAPASGNVSIVVGGCGNGPNADDFPVFHRLGGYPGKLAINSYDINELAIAQAKEGQYNLFESLFEKAEASETVREQTRVLQELGFTVFQTRDEELNGRPDMPEVISKIDAKPVRSGHDMTFNQHNLIEPLLLRRTFSLAVANNVLFHLPQDQALQAVTTLAATISPENGLLSLGEHGFMGQLTSHETLAKRRDKILLLLRKSFGLERLHIPSAPKAIVFARPELHAQVRFDGQGVGVSLRLSEQSLETA